MSQWIELQQTTRSHDCVDHGRTPARHRVADVHPVFRADLCRRDVAFDRVLIDVDMIVGRLGIPDQLGPAVQGVFRSIAQMTARQFSAFELFEVRLQAPEDRPTLRVAIEGALRVSVSAELDDDGVSLRYPGASTARHPAPCGADPDPGV